MSLLSIMTAIAHKRIQNATNPTSSPIKTQTPLNMHQGSVVNLPDVDIALAQVDGSVIKAPTGTQIVTAVGAYTLFGMNVYNSYLNDGASFIQTVTKNNVLQEARLFCSYAEIVPQTVEEWEFWLGSYEKDDAGQFVRDGNGIALRKEVGLIGWNQFQVDGPPPIVYNKTWNTPPNESTVSYYETITDSTGSTTVVYHEAMEYYRLLTDNSDAIVESLLVGMCSQNQEASINVFIGIPLDIQTLSVTAA
jgi:hypothetical protein